MVASIGTVRVVKGMDIWGVVNFVVHRRSGVVSDGSGRRLGRAGEMAAVAVVMIVRWGRKEGVGRMYRRWLRIGWCRVVVRDER